MGTFGFKDSENILGSGKHELHQFYMYVLSEGDGTNVKARVYNTSDIAWLYNAAQNVAEVTSIESGDDGTYFEYPSGSDVILGVKPAGLDGTPIGVVSIIGASTAPNNNTPYFVTGSIHAATNEIRIGLYDMTSTLIDIRSWAVNKGFAAYITYITAAS